VLAGLRSVASFPTMGQLFPRRSELIVALVVSCLMVASVLGTRSSVT
jgi:hypothetical protein